MNMKKTVGVVLSLVLLMCGCASGQSMSTDDEISDYYKNLSEFSCQVTARTDYGDRVIDFVFDYDLESDGNQNFKLISPEVISGLTASVEQGSVELTFDDTVVYYPELPDTKLSPLQMFPLALFQWKNGYLTASGKDKIAGVQCWQQTFMTTQNETVINQQVWFSSDNYAPVVSELFVDGALVVRFTFSSFTAAD